MTEDMLQFRTWFCKANGGVTYGNGFQVSSAVENDSKDILTVHECRLRSDLDYEPCLKTLLTVQQDLQDDVLTQLKHLDMLERDLESIEPDMVSAEVGVITENTLCFPHEPRSNYT